MANNVIKTVKTTGRVPEQTPDSLIKLVWMLIKGLVKSIPKNLPLVLLRSALIFFGVMLFNYWIIAVKNQGYGSGPMSDPKNPLYGFFNVGSNKAAFSLLAFLAGTFLSLLIGQIRTNGFKGFFRNLFHTFNWTGYCISTAGYRTLPTLLFTAATMMLFGIFTQNTPLFITIAFGSFFGYISQNRNLTFLFARCGWFDFQRVFKGKQPLQEVNPGVAGLLSLGAFLGAIFLIIMPVAQLRLFSIILMVVFLTLGILLVSKKVRPEVVAGILFFTFIQLLFFRLFGRIWADDGGEDEIGGNIITYINDPAGSMVVKSGVMPGVLGVVGSLIGSGASWIWGAAGQVVSGVAVVVKGVAGAAVDATIYVGGAVVSGVKTVGGAVVDGAKYVGGAIVDTAKEIPGVVEDMFKPEVMKNFVKNVVNDFKQAGQGIKEFGKEVISVAKDLVNPEIMSKTIADSWTDLKGGIEDIWNHPEIITDTLKGSWETTKEVGTGIAKGIWKTITDPKEAWKAVKESIGATDFSHAMDPNKSLLQRIGHVGAGTLKLGATLATLGQAKVALGAAKNLIFGGGKAAGAKGAGALANAGKNFPRANPNKLPVKYGAQYKPSGKVPTTSGMTNKSKKAFQAVADEMGLQTHVRPTSQYAKGWLENGKAIPKPMPVKMKSLDTIDSLIGGPQNKEGLVGMFRPQRPPKNVMKNLSKDLQDKINKRFIERANEYKKYKNNIPSTCEWKNGLIIDKKTNLPYASDNDVLGFSNFDGTPVPDAVNKQAIKKLQKYGAEVEHNHHLDTSWKTKGGTERKGKLNIINDAKEGGKGLNTFNPHNDPTHTYMGGRTINLGK